MVENCDSGEIPVSKEIEQANRQKSTPQYASGGTSGMQMAMPSAVGLNPHADIKSQSTGQEDFLMIQLSSFEGRAGY